MNLSQMAGVIRMKGHTIADVCEHLGIVTATFYIRFRRNTWMVKDVLDVCEYLGATEEERNHIFFG